MQNFVVVVTFFVFGMTIDWLVRELWRWRDQRREARGERTAHEALKAQSAELLAKRQAMPDKVVRVIGPPAQPAATPKPPVLPADWTISPVKADWPTHVEHPLADPATETAAIPVVETSAPSKPGKHAQR